jgi:hypothetical protein
MRIPKLAIWDPDEILSTGIYMEGDRTVDPTSSEALMRV